MEKLYNCLGLGLAHYLTLPAFSLYISSNSPLSCSRQEQTTQYLTFFLHWKQQASPNIYLLQSCFWDITRFGIRSLFPCFQSPTLQFHHLPIHSGNGVGRGCWGVTWPPASLENLNAPSVVPTQSPLVLLCLTLEPIGSHKFKPRQIFSPLSYNKKVTQSNSLQKSCDYQPLSPTPAACLSPHKSPTQCLSPPRTGAASLSPHRNPTQWQLRVAQI